jgi:Spy/CpxP family protein refolding chaperone
MNNFSMNYFLKYRFAIWAIIILSAIILSSVGTLLVLKQKHEDDEARRHGQISRFFKEELKLTPEQEKAFKVSRHQFFRNSRIIFDSLEKTNRLIIEELCKPQPDSAILYHLSDQIGNLHAKWKHESIRNLLNLRSICTPEQVQKLNTINAELIGPTGPMHRMGHKEKKPENKRNPD